MIKVSVVALTQNTTAVLVQENEAVEVIFNNIPTGIGGLPDLSSANDRFSLGNTQPRLTIPAGEILYGYTTNPSDSIKMLIISLTSPKMCLIPEIA